MYDSLEVGKSQVHVVRMTEWLPKNWNNRQGRVTLVGDAAHQFPPYRGEAINHGFVDAATLARLLGCADDANDPSYTASQAIHDYEALMLPRAQMAVILSREAMYNAHDWSRLGAGPLYGQTWSEELGWFGDDTGIVLADDDGYPQFEEDAERMCKSPELNHCYNDGSTARNEAQARRGLESQQVTMKLVEEAQGSQSMGPI